MLRFRELDGQAREALEALLESLPAPPASEASAAGPERSPDEVLEDIEELLVRVGPLDSPLVHFTARLTERGELALLLTRRAGAGDDPASPSGERALASVRRSGPAAFRIAPAAGPDFPDVDPILSSRDVSRDG